MIESREASFFQFNDIVFLLFWHSYLSCQYTISLKSIKNTVFGDRVDAFKFEGFLAGTDYPRQRLSAYS